MESNTIGIVGAGFTGSLLAAQLVRGATGPLTVVLIERRGRFGPGLAYSTADQEHLLNVRASNMSAFPDDPQHFLRWLTKRRQDADGAPATGMTFASRRDYGDYLTEVLATAVATAAPGVHVERINGEAVGLTMIPGGVRLQLDGLRYIDVRKLALCTGHLPPVAPPGVDEDVQASDRYIADPWGDGALDRIGREAPVMIVGTGLTMVDVVLSLRNRGHRGKILSVSRRGFLPQVHADTAAFVGEIAAVAVPATVTGLLRAMRHDAAQAELLGLGWRSAFDAMRPLHHALWGQLSPGERRRFLRHLRPYWDVHRHRMAPAVAAQIDGLLADGHLQVRAGRIQTVAQTTEGLTVSLRPRRGGPAWSAEVAALINCSGPSSDYGRSPDPVVRAVLEQGLARPDALRLGLDVTQAGALIDEVGIASTRLFAFGPLSKAPFYEMTAVPELRGQCAAAAKQLAI